MRRAGLVVSRPGLKPILCVAVLLAISLVAFLRWQLVPPALAQSVYNLRIHAIVLSDDDGSEPSTITPQQVVAWVNKANAMLTAAGAGIQLQFDPNPNGPDWEAMRNTALNHLCSGDGSWPAANNIAARYPGKIVYFFRFTGCTGSGANPGNGFAFPPQSNFVTNFVALPGIFNNTSVCIKQGGPCPQNIWQLAHETGHYLGLYHTFPGWSDQVTGTQAQALTFIQQNGNTLQALDGDQLADTAPDGGATLYINTQMAASGTWDMCNGPASFQVGGFTVTPPRNNVMSYFACEPMGFTPDQVRVMRSTLQLDVRKWLIQQPCFPDFHGLPVELFQTCFDYWVHRGLWPVTLSAYMPGVQVKMAGSFQVGANRPVRHMITAQQYEQAFLDFRAAGFRPGHVNILNIASELRFTAIWTPIDGEFQSYWGMTPEQYESRWQQYRSQGYLQADLFIYQDNGLKFAATWVRKPFVDYASYWGMTSDQYNNRFTQFWNQGLRVTHFIAYPDSGGWRFAAIWEKVPGAWAHYYGMSSDEYQQKYNMFASQGLRLWQVQGYGDRYSAVWFKP